MEPALMAGPVASHPSVLSILGPAHYDALVSERHECPGVNCGHQALPPEAAMCRSCWLSIPRPARRRVFVAANAHRREPTDEHRKWLRRAQLAAIRELEAVDNGAVQV